LPPFPLYYILWSTDDDITKTKQFVTALTILLSFVLVPFVFAATMNKCKDGIFCILTENKLYLLRKQVEFCMGFQGVSFYTLDEKMIQYFYIIMLFI
jgi:hypothetical protein